jgi:hypothetical protein
LILPSFFNSWTRTLNFTSIFYKSKTIIPNLTGYLISFFFLPNPILNIYPNYKNIWHVLLFNFKINIVMSSSIIYKQKGSSRACSYGSWIYNYLCN